MFPSGKKVLGRLNATVVTTATVIPFTDLDGNTHTFAVGERLVVYAADLNSGGAAAADANVRVFQDHNGDGAFTAGEQFFGLTFGAPANAGQSDNVNFNSGLGSRKINAAGTNTFYAITTAAGGAIDLLIVGEIIKT